MTSNGVASSSERLPSVPAQRYFTVAEAERLCGVPAWRLRQWMRAYLPDAPARRRYLLRHEVLLLRQVRALIDKGLAPASVRAVLDAVDLVRAAEAQAHQTLEAALARAEGRLAALAADVRAALGEVAP